MKRRTMLGLAAITLTGCGGGEPKAVAPRAGRRKIGHVPNGGNNYEWATEELHHRAQMLALTVMLFNGTSKPQAPPKAEGYFIDFMKNRDQSGISGADHPLKDVNAKIYTQTWDYCKQIGWQAANDQLWTAAEVMWTFSNKGLNGLRDQPYDNPDECPCEYRSDKDCPPVNPLL